MQKLKAGNIELIYENGFLRYFKVHQTEVLRMMYFAIRDANWGNLDPVFYDEKIEKYEDAFKINYKVKYVEKGHEFFKWNVEIIGLKSSEVTFEIKGEALQEFKTNRAGFCVLHPIEGISGEKVTVMHVNGEKEDYAFPKNISAHQPFLEICTMSWEIENSKFEIRFEGDIFETEDHRNWGDASFKTYCTPQRLPFPKTLKTGDVVHQKVIFSLNNLGKKTTVITATEPKNNSDFALGIAAVAENKILPIAVIENIKTLKLSHYRVEVDMGIDWESSFNIQNNDSQKLELALDLNLILSDNFEQEISEFFEKNTDLDIRYLTVLSQNELVSSQALIDYIPVLKNKLKNIKIGIGTNYNFTEINRNRFDAATADFISMSFSPTEHATDNLTIMENAETVKYLVQSTIAMCGKPVHLSPIALKRRFNPYATEKTAVNISIENQKDERQKTEFLAKWTKVLKENLEKSGVESVTLFQTHGELGIMNVLGEKYPVYGEMSKNI
jgi:D-apionolactonase